MLLKKVVRILNLIFMRFGNYSARNYCLFDQSASVLSQHVNNIHVEPKRIEYTVLMAQISLFDLGLLPVIRSTVLKNA